MIKSAKIVLLMLAVVAVFGSFGLSQAADCRPGGSPTNHAGSCETAGGDVRCGGTPTQGISAGGGAGGVEVCAEDGGASPIEGRVGLDVEEQTIYLDGGDNNQAPANGWMRIDQSGPNCGDGSKPSYNQGGGSAGNCG